MSFGIIVSRAIKDAQVTFNANVNTAEEALSIATLLATGDAPAPTAKQEKVATEKNVKSADNTAKVSTEKQTPTASDSSASSSTESSKDDAGAKDKQADAAPALDYEKDIKPLVLTIAKISREKAEALLQRFGVTSAKNLKADQFAEFKEKAELVIDGKYDPVASDEGALA
ncbi:hypothetical protein [Achromobacter pestifer]|uniref:Uncharacterized protein n=1 Tax=Achromobacter pestifer TaxID=1353889 RepID=A0A6S6ZG68_9BURK|nr:hypothetical protein [Achromobacter pestifer]CAB3624575.1 hypothetical protein LMG3431_00036 [Achromobacter pestifer]